jgi:3'-5' exoribonuclease
LQREKSQGEKVNKQIKSFIAQDKVQGCYYITQKSMLMDKNSKPYLSFNLNDKTGAINARVWDNAEELSKEFDSGDVVHIKGHVQSYQNKLQFVIHQLRPAENNEYDMRLLVKSADRSSSEYMDELLRMVADITDDNIKQLVTNVLNDKEVQERLLKYPAARSIHHAYFGGLIEHMVGISKTLKYLSEIHKHLNYDYLIFGAIFHDIGKLWELSIENGINYTTAGRLVGHIQIGCELVDKFSQKILGFPDKLRYELKHIILSHHGKYEYGSPKRPKFLEAMVVAMVDELDSKINTATQAMLSEVQDGNEWSSFQKNFDRYLYLDIFAKKQNED